MHTGPRCQPRPAALRNDEAAGGGCPPAAVPRRGFEPPRFLGRQTLNLVRLPVPPPGREGLLLAGGGRGVNSRARARGAVPNAPAAARRSRIESAARDVRRSNARHPRRAPPARADPVAGRRRASGAGRRRRGAVRREPPASQEAAAERAAAALAAEPPGRVPALRRARRPAAGRGARARRGRRAIRPRRSRCRCSAPSRSTAAPPCWPRPAGPRFGVTYGQGITRSDDLGALGSFDWSKTELRLGGFYRRPLGSTGAFDLAGRLGLAWYANFGSDWVYSENHHDRGLELSPALIFSTHAAGGIFSVTGEAPITVTVKHGVGAALLAAHLGRLRGAALRRLHGGRARGHRLSGRLRRRAARRRARRAHLPGGGRLPDILDAGPLRSARAHQRAAQAIASAGSRPPAPARAAGRRRGRPRGAAGPSRPPRRRPSPGPAPRGRAGR